MIEFDGEGTGRPYAATCSQAGTIRAHQPWRASQAAGSTLEASEPADSPRAINCASAAWSATSEDADADTGLPTPASLCSSASRLPRADN
jgi:hypothetical protein